jgi:hypothetical protein
VFQYDVFRSPERAFDFRIIDATDDDAADMDLTALLTGT